MATTLTNAPPPTNPPLYSQQGPQQHAAQIPQIRQTTCIQPQFTGVQYQHIAQSSEYPQSPMQTIDKPLMQHGEGPGQRQIFAAGVASQPPVQPFGAPQLYTAAPLHSLGPGPGPIDCPSCRHRAITIANFESGNTTHVWALVLCFLTGHGCIPYCMTSTKDVKHNCGHCGILLATWHRSGRTVVHAFG